MMPWPPRIKDRALEWLFATYTLVFGVWLSGAGSALNPVSLKLVLDLVPEPVWAASFLGVGCVHCTALAINGSAWWTPHVRVLAGVLNFAAYALLTVGIHASTPGSSGVPTYGYLVLGGMAIIILRASRDAFALRRAARQPTRQAVRHGG